MDIISAVKDIITAPTACAELKEAAQAYLNAAGTDRQAAAATALINEIGEDLNTIDNTIAFAGSDKARELMGEEAAAGLLAHAREIKAAGAGYCDCPGCAAAKVVLDHKDLL